MTRTTLCLYGLLALSLSTVGCGSERSSLPPPPVAGMQHPEVSRVGQIVSFDASPSLAGVLRDADGVVVDQAEIVQFRFLVADGGKVLEQTSPVAQHIFASAGLYAVEVEVVDRLGRVSTALSRIHITEDFATTCSDDKPAECPSGRCLQGVCNRIACAGQQVCPEDTTCAELQCLLTPPTNWGQDVYVGTDGGAVTVADDAAAVTPTSDAGAP